MPLETVPASPQTDVPPVSDIARVVFNGRKLVILIARKASKPGRFEGIQYTFPWVTGFRYLDESDLLRYLSSPGLRRGHHLLSVSSGGWAEEEFTREGLQPTRREWLVITGNGCVSVFAHDEPEVAEGEFDDEA